MKKKNLICLTLVLFISCSKQGDSSEWSFTKIFTTDKTIENLSITDNKFIFEAPDGKKSECYLNIKDNSKEKKINSKELISLIKLIDKTIKERLRLPSGYIPLEYNITIFEDEEIMTKVSYSAIIGDGSRVIESQRCYKKVNDKFVYCHNPN